VNTTFQCTGSLLRFVDKVNLANECFSFVSMPPLLALNGKLGTRQGGAVWLVVKSVRVTRFWHVRREVAKVRDDEFGVSKCPLKLCIPFKCGELGR
jgi:hypothetical protein